MNIFDELGKMYFEIDNVYARTEIEARSRGHRKKEANVSRKRRLNDQLYYLFMFTRLEERIKELSDEVIDERITISNWRNRRTWEMLKSKGDKGNLMDRVSILTPFNGADYQLIQRYKNERDKIAHGGLATITINIPNVLNNMKRLFVELNQ